MRKRRVLLVSMPFGALERQALGLSLLKSRLVEEGIPCDIRYFTFGFAGLIGAEDYAWITTELPHTAFAGEWIFSAALHGAHAPPAEAYVREVLQGTWYLEAPAIERVLRARAMAGCFIETCLHALDWDAYGVVGFTSTFEQNAASLALARRIKAAHPDAAIVFGGANWEGEMGLEYHRRFPFVDYACTGEADESFPALVRVLLGGAWEHRRLDGVPGVIHRRGGASVESAPSQPVADLDRLPTPDYGDYFHGLERSSAGSYVVPTLLFESSRGCWWGARNHCMFCGLNGGSLAYRAKSAKRLLGEIDQLVARWRIDTLQAVDNVVHMAYFRDLFPALARRAGGLRFFYEIRANLSREQVRLLRDAGVDHVQPGIESMNDRVLRLMRKGTTALQNVQVLKWCAEYGVRADWNLLYGFPGEGVEDAERLLAMLSQVRFLGPPTACGPVRLDRFSPYFENPEAHGLVHVRPVRPYRHLHPWPDETLRRIAYYFDYDYAPGVCAAERAQEIVAFVNEWKADRNRGVLRAVRCVDGGLGLVDTRPSALRNAAVLRGLDRDVYVFCDSARTVSAIAQHIRAKRGGVDPGEAQIRAFLDALVAHGYMISDGSRYLSLALSLPVQDGANAL